MIHYIAEMGDTISPLSIPPILICNSDMILSSRDVLSKAGEVVAARRSNIKPKNVDMILHIPVVGFSAPKLHTSALTVILYMYVTQTTPTHQHAGNSHGTQLAAWDKGFPTGNGCRAG